jgi:hypothetical protein
MECKGWWTLNTRMGWNICEVFLHALKMIKPKFQETSTFGMIRHGLRELGNYFSWKQIFIIVCNKKSWFSFKFSSTKFLFIIAFDLIYWNRCGLVENLKMFTIVLQCLHLQSEVHSPYTTKKQIDDKISIHVVDHIFAYSSLALILQ